MNKLYEDFLTYYQLQKHLDDHGAEFGLSDTDEYEQAANKAALKMNTAEAGIPFSDAKYWRFLTKQSANRDMRTFIEDPNSLDVVIVFNNDVKIPDTDKKP